IIVIQPAVKAGTVPGGGTSIGRHGGGASMWRFLGAVALWVGLACPAIAGQTVIRDYDTARDQFFWAQLYFAGGEELYCAADFAAGQRKIAGRNLSVEHAYPAD